MVLMSLYLQIYVDKVTINLKGHRLELNLRDSFRELFVTKPSPVPSNSISYSFNIEYGSQNGLFFLKEGVLCILQNFLIGIS